MLSAPNFIIASMRDTSARGVVPLISRYLAQLDESVEKDVAPRQGTIGDPESTMFVRNYEITLNKEIILEIVGDKGVRINFLAPMGIW